MVEEQKQQITEEMKEEVPAKGTEEETQLKNGEPKEEKGSEKTNGHEEKSETGEEDDDESSDEELGLLEKPVEILYTKRDRKSTEVFVTKPKEEKKEVELDYTKGKGVKLADIPIVKHNVTYADMEDLGVLHRMMYRKQGKQHNTKRNIREFCGWPFEKGSKEYRSSMNIIDRLLPAALKWTLDLLAVDRNEMDTEQMRSALVEFLWEPKMNEKEIPTPKAKAAKRKSSGTPKSKKSKTPSKGKSKKSNDEEESDVSDISDEESEGEKKKTKKKSVSKKPNQVKIALPKKKSKGASKKKDSSDDSEDDEPLNKKSKSPPSNAELKKVVSAILKDADLELVTMKSVVKQVYDKYAQFDLTSRKDFIKTTVKELIS